MIGPNTLAWFKSMTLEELESFKAQIKADLQSISKNLNRHEAREKLIAIDNEITNRITGDLFIDQKQ